MSIVRKIGKHTDQTQEISTHDFLQREKLFLLFELKAEKKLKMPNDHNHQHGEGCAHESSDSDYMKEIGIQYSLFKKIDIDNLECLNETVDGSAKFIFKPYEERLNFDKVNLWCKMFFVFSME